MTLAGVGIGWRPELAGFAARRDGLGFAEVVAESVHDGQPLPDGLAALLARGVPVVPHGVRLSLGSAEEPDPARVARLAGLAERLAAEQAALVRALVGGGPVPGGFDPERVRATAAALARKRAGEVARAWPGLAAELGPAFTKRFLADAARRPPPARGGALADGLAFADALARSGRLPPAARVERLLARARLSTRPARLAATLTGSPRRLVVTVRAPGLGERWLSLPFS